MVPRIARNKLNTPFFHVIVQGINKEYIFYKKQYIDKYKNLLLENSKKYEINIISYCIMNNHAHILLYTEKIIELSKFMKSINTSYAKYYNKGESRVGFVFRNRYETEPIYEKKHLVNCMSYIHNNPVKAKMVKKIGAYKYSSYNDYIYRTGIATEQTIKLLFGDNKNFLEIYNVIHTKNYEFKDYISDINYKSKYDYLKPKDIEEIVSNKNQLEKILIEMVKENKMPINKASEILGISRFKISRILNNK